MNILKFLYIVCFTFILCTSCNTFKHSYRLSDVLKNEIEPSPTILDVETDFTRKVSGISDKRTNSIQDAKDNAYYNAISQNKIDVLVDPIYEIKVRKGLFRSSAKAEVVGFAGKYVNPRTDLEDSKNEYDIKIEKLNNFLSIEEIKDEKRSSVRISTSENGSAISITPSSSFSSQFNSLFYNKPLNIVKGSNTIDLNNFDEKSELEPKTIDNNNSSSNNQSNNSSQKRAYKKGDVLLGLSVGVGNKFFSYNNTFDESFIKTPFLLNTDFFVHNNISLGVYVGYGRGNSFSGKTGSTNLGIRSNFHLWQMIDSATKKSLSSNRFDYYLSPYFGYNIRSAEFGSIDNRFQFGVSVGLRFFITEKIGLFTEFGSPTSITNFGLNIKL